MEFKAKNQIKCNVCGGVAFSRYNGNYAACNCGKVFIDEVHYPKKDGTVGILMRHSTEGTIEKRP